jgi:putative transposase
MITYCYKLYRAKRNKKLHKAINIAGCIYNHCIALHRRYYRLYGKHLSANKLKVHITKLKKTKKYSYWNQLGSQAIQDIVERIDKGYKLFFRNQKHSIKSAPPSFRKVRKYRSFTLKQTGYKLLDGNRIKIMGNEYKFHKSREVDGIIKTVTVKRDTLGDLYIYIVCEQEEAKIEPRSSKSVGFDFGLITFLTSSDGQDVEAPLFFKENSTKIKKLNRKLSRKKKGSNNRKLARLDLARLHKKVSNQRKDYHFKLAKKLAEEYAVICIEDLNIKAMQQLWGRKISDLGHSQFVGILKHQCAKTGCKVVEIPRFYPSSKTCSDCGYVNSTLSLSERTWTCPECGVIHDRDKNAAVNIHRVGASTLDGEGVRPALAGILQ